VVQDGINEYGLEISSSLLSRFSITDQSLNALLSGQSVQFDDEEVKNIQATLGRSGSDLDPSIEFTRDNTPGSYSVESVIERLIGLANLDIRLIELPAVPNISSEIAPPSVAAVGNIQRTDDDGDGFLEVIVAADGTIVDGNRDGIADATQSQVAGLRLINDGSVGSDYGAISVGEDVQLQDVTLVLAEVEGFIPVTTVGGGTVVTSTPQGVTNAFAGVISFKVAGVTPGGTTSANISFPSGLPADTGNAYLRFNYSTNRFEEFLDANGNPLYTFIDSDGDGTVDGVSLTLTDGDPNWDGDGVANGTVVDPGFLGIGERNLTGTKRGDSLIGNVLANTLSGMNGNDWLEGDLANDVLTGGRGKDRIFGGEGADRITGGKHRDRYYYTDASESSVDQRDTVKFGKNDRFVFTSFDGDTITEGIQTLSFIGKQAFSGTAGELRATRSVLEADTTGDGFANFAVNLRGTPISSDNMVL
jgi:Ca2+-binding RTX toxin-like protein